MSDEKPAAPEAAPAEGGKKKSPLIKYAAIGVVLLGGIGGGAYWWTARAAAPAEEKPVEASERGIVSFQPFVVNLADPGNSRYLRVSLQLVVKDEEQAKELEETPVSMSLARSAILEYLTTQTSTELVKPEGKAALREAVKERVSHAVGHLEVIDVLFTDFVVQF